MKRLFVAADLDEATREAVADISSRLQQALNDAAPSPGRPTRITWVRPDRFHLTLEFLGEVSSSIEQQAVDALARPFPLPAFDLSFRGIGFFPERGSPRVLWLGIAEGLHELRQLHRLLLSRLTLPSPPSNTEYTPHLTLARFRDRTRSTELKGLHRIEASAGPARIDRVTLYESRLSSKGPTHVALAEASLSPCS